MNDYIQIESIDDLHRFFKTPKPRHPLISVLDAEPLSVPLSQGEIRFSTELYIVMIKKHLSGDFFYGREQFDFKEGAVLCMKPGQVITITDSQPELHSKGTLLFFHPELIREYPLGRKIYEYNYFNYMINEALFPSDAEKESLLSIMEKIDGELNMNIDNYTQDLLVSNLDLLLNYLNRYYGRQFITRSSVNRDTVSRFETFLLDYINSGKIKEAGLPTVAFCAEKMNYSSHYLSDLLKKETGKTTQEHIHHQLFEKAKTLLLGTDMTVNEIAYELGFEYPHYFSQTFKKKTGYSPKEFKAIKGIS